MEISHNVDKALWWNVAEACPYATFFHTPLWADIVTAENDAVRPQTVAAKLQNGTTLILPLMQMNPGGNRVFRRLHSTYAGCYGGVIADGPLTSEVSEIYQAVCNWRTAELSVVESPLADSPTGLEDLNLGNNHTENDFTQLIPLDESYEKIRNRFSDSRQRGIRKAQEKDVVVTEAKSLCEYRAYFEAYQESLERWEEVSSTYSWDLFEKTFKLAQEYPDYIKLWVTKVNNNLASGALIFYWNKHVDYWHGASYREYFEYNINDIIHSEIIRDAVNSGYDYYDFNPSGGNEGVVKFKSKFGPERREIHRWRYEDSTFRLGKRMISAVRQ